MRRALITALLCSSVAAVPPPLSADPILTLRVSPTMAREPGLSPSLPPTTGIRGLEITAESNGYMRSSHIQLDGRDAQRVWDIEFRDVPKGNYDVVGILTGTDGRRATVSRLVVIMPLH